MYLGYTKKEYEKLDKLIDYLISYMIDKNSFFDYTIDGLKLNVSIKNERFYLKFFDNKDKQKYHISISTKERQIIYTPVEDTALGSMCFFKKENRFEIFRIKEEKDYFKKIDGSLLLSEMKSNMLNYFFDKVIKCEKILNIIKDQDEKIIEKIVSKINESNYKEYINLLLLNKDKIYEIVIVHKEMEKYNLDIFNLTKENKDILTLNTDLNFDFKKEENIVSKTIGKEKTTFLNILKKLNKK